MITLELIDYIKAQRAGGTSEAEIRSNLMIGGEWSREDIDEALAVLSGPAPAETKPRRTPLVIGAIAIIFAALALIFFVFVR